MAKKSKPQRITFGSIVRLTIFIIIVYFLISWLSQKPSVNLTASDPTLFVGETAPSNVLGDIYSKLPEDSRYQLENFDQNQVVEFIKSKLDGFPQKQIKEIKKSLIRNISDDMIKNIDQN